MADEEERGQRACDCGPSSSSEMPYGVQTLPRLHGPTVALVSEPTATPDLRRRPRGPDMFKRKRPGLECSTSIEFDTDPLSAIRRSDALPEPLKPCERRTAAAAAAAAAVAAATMVDIRSTGGGVSAKKVVVLVVAGGSEPWTVLSPASSPGGTAKTMGLVLMLAHIVVELRGRGGKHGSGVRELLLRPEHESSASRCSSDSAACAGVVGAAADDTAECSLARDVPPS